MTAIRYSSRLGSIPAGVLLACAVAAAILAPAPVHGQNLQMTPAQRELYDRAKTEGEVSILGPVANEVDWIPAEFGKRFPGITVKPSGDLQAATRIITEARAARQTTDVWTTTIGNMLEVQKRGLLATVDWTPGKIRPDDIFFEGQGAATRNFIFAMLYAKGKVEEKDLPSTWADLLNPKWRGKLIATDFLLPRLMGFLALEWGAEKTEKWGRALIDDQKILITNAPPQSFLRSGERLIEAGGSVDQAFQFTAEGAPTGYKLMELTPAGQFVSAVLKSTTHPNSARLLANWLASDDGRATGIRYANWTDIRPGSTSAVASEVEKSRVKVIFEDAGNVEKRADFYKLFSPWVRGQ